jgi:hypothetical protein
MPAEAYSNVTELFNLPVQLCYPAPVWPLDRRKTILRDENPNYTTGRTLRRRDAAELNVRDVLGWIAAVLHEQPFAARVKHQALPGATGLYRHLGRCAPGMLDLRGKIRAGISWLVEHGPASGWALPNREWSSESTSNFTPYYVPRGSLYVAERWVRVALFVARLVRLFVALAGRVSPAPRSPEAEPPTAKTGDSVPTREARDSTGYRTHSPTDRGGPPRSLAEVLADVRRKYGEGGDDGRRE